MKCSRNRRVLSLYTIDFFAVILMDTRSATTDLKWDQLSLRGDTDGVSCSLRLVTTAKAWTEESWRGLDEKSNERAYVACSFHVANPGNWLFTPLIPKESANILYINILYNTRSCEQYHDPKSCKETSPVSVLTKDTTAEISQATLSVTLKPPTKYVRFGFEENGVCVSLLTITLHFSTYTHIII
ncbi:ephrin receptor ligand binding domain protein [Dictyocaulus viviparus]|uniref:Ephrin receptor ligand binding domain protein n=1 Tax=Dictyocaulus viviparus TaxID=29172 RepID=A0A0D8XME2_DICVI|nr:ephrin receptor ligand binding domain protein [Dictyocaulus viviparus]